MSCNWLRCVWTLFILTTFVFSTWIFENIKCAFIFYCKIFTKFISTFIIISNRAILQIFWALLSWIIWTWSIWTGFSFTFSLIPETYFIIYILNTSNLYVYCLTWWINSTTTSIFSDTIMIWKILFAQLICVINKWST